MTTTTLHAPDIECDGCAASIRKALARTARVGQVNVDVATKTVTVEHEGSVEVVKVALDRAGFPTASPTPQPPPSSE